MIRLHLKNRMPIPDAIAGAPRLRPGLEHYWEAFWLLSTERQLGFGAIGPIPWSSVMAWARHHGMSAAEADVAQHLISCMDHEFLRHTAKRTES